MSSSRQLPAVGEVPDAEHHLAGRSNWLRAMVLGANDGLVSTACLVLGVAAAGADSSAILTAGVAGLVAGALSMATGEYVSVSSQRDVEEADLALEASEIERNPDGELKELAAILSMEVARALTAHDALDAHRRDELGLADELAANPLQAAWTSAAAFSSGALIPVLSVALAPASVRIAVCVAITLTALAGLGAVGAHLGGADRRRALIRVLIWGAVAMAVTLGVGALVGQTGI